jgi:hypothetical protein
MQTLVGSLSIRIAFNPAYLAASLVAERCLSLNHEGTEITACLTFSPRYNSADYFRLDSIRVEAISGDRHTPLVVVVCSSI